MSVAKYFTPYYTLFLNNQFFRFCHSQGTNLIKQNHNVNFQWKHDLGNIFGNFNLLVRVFTGQSMIAEKIFTADSFFIYFFFVHFCNIYFQKLLL